PGPRVADRYAEDRGRRVRQRAEAIAAIRVVEACAQALVDENRAVDASEAVAEREAALELVPTRAHSRVRAEDHPLPGDPGPRGVEEVGGDDAAEAERLVERVVVAQEEAAAAPTLRRSDPAHERPPGVRREVAHVPARPERRVEVPLARQLLCEL